MQRAGDRRHADVATTVVQGHRTLHVNVAVHVQIGASGQRPEQRVAIAEPRERMMAKHDHQAPVRRIKTKPSRTAKEKRLVGKAIRGDVKKGRSKVSSD